MEISEAASQFSTLWASIPRSHRHLLKSYVEDVITRPDPVGAAVLDALESAREYLVSRLSPLGNVPGTDPKFSSDSATLPSSCGIDPESGSLAVPVDAFVVDDDDVDDAAASVGVPRAVCTRCRAPATPVTFVSHSFSATQLEDLFVRVITRRRAAGRAVVDVGSRLGVVVIAAGAVIRATQRQSKRGSQRSVSGRAKEVGVTSSETQAASAVTDDNTEPATKADDDAWVTDGDTDGGDSSESEPSGTEATSGDLGPIFALGIERDAAFGALAQRALVCSGPRPAAKPKGKSCCSGGSCSRRNPSHAVARRNAAKEMGVLPAALAGMAARGSPIAGTSVTAVLQGDFFGEDAAAALAAVGASGVDPLPPGGLVPGCTRPPIFVFNNVFEWFTSDGAALAFTVPGSAAAPADEKPASEGDDPRAAAPPAEAGEPPKTSPEVADVSTSRDSWRRVAAMVPLGSLVVTVPSLKESLRKMCPPMSVVAAFEGLPIRWVEVQLPEAPDSASDVHLYRVVHSR
eukprot:TRINITY_DN2308_c0_g1_i1.p1 TRINITY_DN2308_c0_g1~~TRINITY_DN2308_c0_g1_i1.p1  ORF type:complete len:517 (-),score=55.86 TRINITY_DN2308_c0_g1_i1:105-1655(-)